MENLLTQQALSKSHNPQQLIITFRPMVPELQLGHFKKKISLDISSRRLCLKLSLTPLAAVG
jgi:hypothetical protein